MGPSTRRWTARSPSGMGRPASRSRWGATRTSGPGCCSRRRWRRRSRRGRHRPRTAHPFSFGRWTGTTHGHELTPPSSARTCSRSSPTTSRPAPPCCPESSAASGGRSRTSSTGSDRWRITREPSGAPAVAASGTSGPGARPARRHTVREWTQPRTPAAPTAAWVAWDAWRATRGGPSAVAVAPAAAPGHPGRARPAGVALLRRAVCRPAARDDGAATAAAGDQAAADGALRRLGDRPGRDPRRRRGVRRRRRQHRGGPPRPVRRVHDLGLHRRADPAGAGPPGDRGDDRPRVRPDRRPAHAPAAGRHPAPRRPAGGGLRHRRPLPDRGDVRAAAAGARGCGGGWRGSSP